jgi:hypothetical protein
MVKKIDKRIIGVSVKDDGKSTPDKPVEAEDESENVVQMHEKLERPESLIGETYKIKTPQSEHALYVTINDIVLNPGTEHELRRPFEIFINSKNMDHFQWIVALTRIISAVFRKGGDVTFLVEELLISIGILQPAKLDAHQEAFVAAKRADYAKSEGTDDAADGEAFPPTATLCNKCMTKAAIYLDGCLTCLNCGDSKCS